VSAAVPLYSMGSSVIIASDLLFLSLIPFPSSGLRPVVFQWIERESHEAECGQRLAPCAVCRDPHHLPLKDVEDHYDSVDEESELGPSLHDMLQQRAARDIARQQPLVDVVTGAEIDSESDQKQVMLIPALSSTQYPRPPPVDAHEDAEAWEDFDSDVPHELRKYMRCLFPRANSLHVSDALRIARFLATGGADSSANGQLLSLTPHSRHYVSFDMPAPQQGWA
jgi:hypothetical protein